jgi:hypothetical protein
MGEDIKSLQSITHHITHFFRGASDISRAERHWRVLLIVGVFVSTTILLFSIYFFFGINRGDLFIVDPTDPLPIDTIDRTKLNTILSAFEERRTLFESYQEKGPTLTDPSK